MHNKKNHHNKKQRITKKNQQSIQQFFPFLLFDDCKKLNFQVRY